jgi:hypothetical protein
MCEVLNKGCGQVVTNNLLALLRVEFEVFSEVSVTYIFSLVSGGLAISFHIVSTVSRQCSWVLIYIGIHIYQISLCFLEMVIGITTAGTRECTNVECKRRT